MTVFQAIILGLVQGLTEFLPVSSSGHLVIVQQLLGVQGGTLTFDVMVHFGTLLAVLIALKEDWLPIWHGVMGDPKHVQEGRRRLALVVIGSIPIAVVGLLFKDRIEQLFQSATVVGWMLLVTGVILWFSDRWSMRVQAHDKPLSKVGFVDALIVGIGQSFAVIPGLSRSGTTIGTGLLSGLQREAAARFAFLLAIPAILGATIVELPRVIQGGMENLFPVVVGTITAAISGYFGIRLFLKVIRSTSLFGFALYTWIVGVLVIVLARN